MVPEGFLNDAQKQAKQDALARESGKIRKLSFSLKDASPTDISALEDVSGKPTWIPAVHAIDAITLHMLRHPYVKHTTKKYNSEKQKTQATKMDLIAWVFRFCIFNYSKRSWIL